MANVEMGFLWQREGGSGELVSSKVLKRRQRRAPGLAWEGAPGELELGEVSKPAVSG